MTLDNVITNLSVGKNDLCLVDALDSPENLQEGRLDDVPPLDVERGHRGLPGRDSVGRIRGP